MSLLERLDVPAAQSRCSIRATVRPRVAASRAAPVPVTPPPTIATSNTSLCMRCRLSARCSGPRRLCSMGSPADEGRKASGRIRRIRALALADPRVGLRTGSSRRPASGRIRRIRALALADPRVGLRTGSSRRPASGRIRRIRALALADPRVGLRCGTVRRIGSGPGAGPLLVVPGGPARPTRRKRPCGSPRDASKETIPLSSDEAGDRSFRVRNLTAGLTEPESDVRARALSAVGLSESDIRGFRIARRSLDARRRGGDRSLRFALQADVVVRAGVRSAAWERAVRAGRVVPCPASGSLTVAVRHPSLAGARVAVVGSGPAGLFAALTLARNGVAVDLLDRGAPLADRGRAVARFQRARVLDPESNLLFGEGGAGTYSDGKLYTRIDHPLEVPVLEELIAAGAPADIAVDSRAHIGTDRLHRILPRLRAQLEGQGVRFHWHTRVDGWRRAGDPARITALRTSRRRDRVRCGDPGAGSQRAGHPRGAGRAGPGRGRKALPVRRARRASPGARDPRPTRGEPRGRAARAGLLRPGLQGGRRPAGRPQLLHVSRAARSSPA